MREQLTVPLPVDGRAVLDVVAKEEGVSVAKWVRRAIDERLLSVHGTVLPPMQTVGRPRLVTRTAPGESVDFGDL